MLAAMSLAMAERASIDEEIYFETPKAVQASTKNAMKRYAKEQKAAGNPHNLSRVCLMGTVACLHDRSLGTDKITGRARTRLDEWIDEDREKRGAKRARDQEEAIGNALRPKLLMAEEKLALPAPLGSVPDADADDSKATALQAAASASAGATGAQLAVLKAHVHALVVAEEVETGALQNAGALPKNASDWYERASRARRKAKEHKYAFSGPRVDNKWHLATYAREKEADESDEANNQTARRRAAYNATADEELWAWFTRGGGKMSPVNKQTNVS